MIKEAIILAGGLGTRLQGVVDDVPKAMAPVNGRPFYHYLIDYLREEGVGDFIFSLGHKSEKIREDLEQNYPRLSYRLSIETEQLGTGGAIHLALKQCAANTVLVCNGDTLFKVKLRDLYFFHLKKLSQCSLALKQLTNTGRYGRVKLAPNGLIEGFEEKQLEEPGLINGGMYIVNRDWFKGLNLPSRSSFEKDVLERQIKKGADIFGKKEKGYFIDIGVPEDYEKAQIDFQKRIQDL